MSAIFDKYEFRSKAIEQSIKHFAEDEKRTPPINEVREYFINLAKPVGGFGFTREDEKEVISRTAESVLNNKDFRIKLDKSVSHKDWIRELRDRAFFIDKDDIPEFIKWALMAVCDIQTTCKNGDVDTRFASDGLNLIINSTMKGTGKSTFESSLVRGAEKLGIAARDEVPLPQGGFHNSLAESENLIVAHMERTDVNPDRTTLKAVGRREKYIFSEKYKMPIEVRGRAIMLGSTNGYSYMSDRTFKTVGVIPIPFGCFPEYIQERARSKDGAYESFYCLKSADSVYSKFLSKLSELVQKVFPKNSDFSESFLRTMANSLIKYDFADLLIQAVEKAKSLGVFNETHSISVSRLRKIAGDIIDTDQKEHGVCRCLQTLLASNKFGLKANQNQREEWWQWNIGDTPIADITIDHLTSISEQNSDDIVEEAMREWDKYIAIFDGIDPDPEKDDETDDGIDMDAFLNELDGETEVKAEERAEYNWIDEPDHSYSDAMRVSPTDKDTDQFETINPTPAFSRKDADVISMRNFVFEMDDTPKAEQLEIAKRLVKDRIVNRVVDSANKSIHMRITVKNEIKSKDEYKYVWRWLNDRYFESKADKACSNPARLTRKMNGLRDGVKPQRGRKYGEWLIDVGECLEKFEKDDRARKDAREMLSLMGRDRSNRPERKETLKETVEAWRDTPLKESILACINGTGHYDKDCWPTVMTAKWLDFSYDQLTDEVYFGSWNISREKYDSLTVE